MKAIIALETHDRRRRRPKNANALKVLTVKPSAYDAGIVHRLIEILAPQENVGNGGERRVMHPAAILQLFVIEAGIIVGGGKLNRVVLRKVSLQDDLAGSVT